MSYFPRKQHLHVGIDEVALGQEHGSRELQVVLAGELPGQWTSSPKVITLPKPFG